MAVQDIWVVSSRGTNNWWFFGPVHVFANVNVGDAQPCRCAGTDVWNGSAWVRCQGPAGDPDARCPHCDHVNNVGR